MIKEVSQWQYLREKYPKQDAISGAAPLGSWRPPASSNARNAVRCTCLTECARSAAATMAARSRPSSPSSRNKDLKACLGGKRIFPPCFLPTMRKRGARQAAVFTAAGSDDYIARRDGSMIGCMDRTIPAMIWPAMMFLSRISPPWSWIGTPIIKSAPGWS